LLKEGRVLGEDRRRCAAICCAGLLVLTGAACGGEGEPTPAAATTVSSAPAVASTTAAATTVQTSAFEVVGIGDSYMTTQDSKGASFMDAFAASLQTDTGHAVHLTDLADESNTTKRVLQQLRTDEAYRTDVAGGDVIVLSVGGNDSDPFGIYPAGTCAPKQAAEECLQAYAPDFAANYEAILSEIEKLRAGKPTAIRVTSADNPFVGWSQSPSTSFGTKFYAQVAAAETAAACAAATRHGGACVDYLSVFGGPDGAEDPAKYLAADHAHPGDEGIRVIADLLTQLGVPELA
jgi:lysophospholipase L1-like esterase